MQNENRLPKLDRVDGAVSSVRIVLRYFQNSGSAETLQYLGGVVLLALLGKIQGVTEKLPHRNRQHHQVFLAAPHPIKTLRWSIHRRQYTGNGIENGS